MKPVFIFALPRSGSTLLQRLLCRSRFWDDGPMGPLSKSVCIRGENLCILNQYENLLAFYDKVAANGQNRPLEEMETAGEFPSMQNELPPREEYARSLGESFLAWVNPPKGCGAWGFKETNHGLGGARRFRRLVANVREMFPGAIVWVHLREMESVIESMLNCPPHWFGSCRKKITARISQQYDTFLSVAIEDSQIVSTNYSQLLKLDAFREKLPPDFQIDESEYEQVRGKVLK